MRRKKHIYLCTNAILLEKSLPRLPRSQRLTLSVHVDGLAPTHDRLLGRPGLFDLALRAIKAAKAEGLRVCTNTTIYKETDIHEIQELFGLLTDVGVDGILVSPPSALPASPGAFPLPGGDPGEVHRPDAQRPAGALFQHAPVSELLRGERHYECTLGQPHPQPLGLALALLPDPGHPLPFLPGAHGEDPWEKYGPGRDPRCSQCMMHSGFEPSVVRRMGLRDLWQMLRWNFS